MTYPIPSFVKENEGVKGEGEGDRGEVDIPLTFASYAFGSRISSAAASPLSGSVGFG